MVNIAYDEFGLFHENAAEYGIVGAVSPVVRRVDVPVAPGRSVSSLVWGRGPVQVVFVHGGAQNAHTWDTVILALGSGLSAVAVDLPGHGHSDWRADGQYSPASLADDLAVVLDSLQTGAVGVVGMSLGGMTAMELAVRHPRLVRRLMMVDITPGVNRAKAKAVLDFVDGPQSFPSFEALLQRTTEHNPTRSESSLRRGILHNAHQLDDGTWQWRYDRGSKARSAAAESESESESEADAAAARPDEAVADDTSALMSPLWDDFAAVRMPLMVVRGSVSPVVDDDDITEARRRQPNIVVEVVDGAGHSVQGDRPLELAALVRGFVLQP
ncbi:MAG: alpha/beta hydrolase [Ilumatobacteraceae bacterium]